MTTPARYTFLPWVRSGLAAGIATRDDPGATLPGRAEVGVTLTVEADGDRDVSKRILLYGPGDVTGLDARQVVRMDPRPGASNHEPNVFPAIELDRPDLPWLFTPARPTASERLRPWLVLVVVKKRPEVELHVARDRPLPVLRFQAGAAAAAELPDLAESWGWAHVQVARTDDLPVDQVLANRPDRVVSRLVCPRKLEPSTAYYACLVPAFRAGVDAGLGRTVDRTAPQQPAWDLAAGIPDGFELPVYHHWAFATGPAGDFESLVRALRALPLPPTVGKRSMDVGAADLRLPQIPAGAPGSVLGLEGALRAPGSPPTPWLDPQRGAYQARLREILNAPEDLAAGGAGDPVVGPHVYGRWHALRARVPATGQRPHWLRELNLDPRHRAAAGFGARIVQENQEALMDAAWRQVGDVLRANELLRQAQLARGASAAIHGEHLAHLDPGILLGVTEPLHVRTRMSPRTLAAIVRDTRLPPTAISPALRRLARPRGPLGRRVLPPEARLARPIVARLNAGEISPVPPAAPPAGMQTLPAPTGMDAWRRRLQGATGILLLLALLLVGAGLVAAAGGHLVLALLCFALALLLLGWAMRRLARASPRPGDGGAALPWGPDEGLLSPEDVAGAPARPTFRLRIPPHLPPQLAGTTGVTAPGTDVAGPLPSAAPGADSPEAARLREALSPHLEALRGLALAALPQPEKPALDLASVKATLLARLDPETVVPAYVRGRIEVPASLWDPDDPIRPIMAAPEFPQPLYESLRDISQDLLLPGLEQVLPDSITIVETNPPFVEAVMVGANYEAGRELLWREYPTDMRGSYFRQFWDVRGRVPQPKTPEEREAAKDIPPIHTWQGRTRLGEHVTGGDAPRLVLLVRGELFRRYPTAVVYAVRARWNETGTARVLGTEERYPLFRGTMREDITFFGFDLTVGQALGSTRPGEDPGWFMVIQQMPTEPRFGLDVATSFGGAPASWDDVTWGHLAADAAAYGALTHVPLAGPRPATSGITSPPGVSWGANAAAMAYITLQRPFRAAIHADDMVRRTQP